MITPEPSYVKFLRHLNSQKEFMSDNRLNLSEVQLINYIALATSQGENMLVGDLISVNYLGSQATLHGRLKSLVTKSYVKLIVDKVDNRRKGIFLTDKAKKYYKTLSTFLERSVR